MRAAASASAPHTAASAGPLPTATSWTSTGSLRKPPKKTASPGSGPRRAPRRPPIPGRCWSCSTGWRDLRAATMRRLSPTSRRHAAWLTPYRISAAAVVSSITLRARHGGPVIAAGVSLGGNALMRWAAEAGDEAARTVSAVAAVCSPVDLAAGSVAIGRGFNRLVYTAMFLRSMKPKALAKLIQHPGLFDGERLMAARNLYEFDDIFTAPVHGFRNADDYYARASAKPHLHRIRIPALVLNALNDPFVPAGSLPGRGEVGPQVTLWRPAGGGHVGFPCGRMPAHARWMPDEVGGWLLQAIR